MEQIIWLPDQSRLVLWEYTFMRETSNFLPTNDISSVWLWRAHLFKHVYAQLRQTKVLLIFENDPVEQNLKMRWDDERVDSPGWTMFYESPSQCSQTGW